MCINGRKFAPTSEVHASVTLLLPTIRNQDMRGSGVLQWHDVHNTVHENGLLVRILQLTHTERARSSYKRIIFLIDQCRHEKITLYNKFVSDSHQMSCSRTGRQL
jgi:hypothetical protein